MIQMASVAYDDGGIGKGGMGYALSSDPLARSLRQSSGTALRAGLLRVREIPSRAKGGRAASSARQAGPFLALASRRSAGPFRRERNGA